MTTSTIRSASGSVRTTVRDNGFAALMQQLADAARAPTRVRTGILDSAPKTDHDGKLGEMTNVQVMYIHEYGAPAANIPPRSVLRATVDERAGDIRKLQTAVARRVYSGALSPRQALGQIGAKVVAWMQARITSNIPPPLAAETVARKGSSVARKGSSVALVDTGQLKSSFTWRVVE